MGHFPSGDRFLRLSKPDSDRMILEFELGLSRAIVRGDTTNVEALQVLGNALTRLGRHKEAVEIDKRVTRLAPEDDVAFYNLACSCSNLGRIDESIDALRRAVSLGYRHVEYMAQDPDLENVRQDPRYQGIVDSIDANKSGNPRG